jgi:hypothetical protein
MYCALRSPAGLTSKSGVAGAAPAATASSAAANVLAWRVLRLPM